MLIERFKNYIKLRDLARYDDKILLAVSGGVDSMVMLYLFVEAGYNVGVAHCNFGLRGAESDEDEVSVEKECAKLGVEHFNIRFDTQAEIDSSGESVQMVARRLRYDWFDKISDEHGYTKIAIAHHSDDSIETFFINLLRGTGLRGLTGINVSRGRIIRPLLFASRREISEYAVANGVIYREDSSNRSTKYLRNKIRLGIIPKIREVSPDFGKTMVYNVERLSVARDFIDGSMALIRKSIATFEGSQATYDLNLIDASLPGGYVLYELLREYGFNVEVVYDIYRSYRAGVSGATFYSVSHIAHLDRGRVIVNKISYEQSYRVEITEGVKREFCLGGVLTFETIAADDIDSLAQGDDTALLDAAKITYPLTLRLWQEGDSFVPLGMEGHKKVSDYLIDAKVPMPEKRRQLVVESGGNITWLVGRRIDDRYKVSDETDSILRITKQQSIDDSMM